MFPTWKWNRESFTLAAKWTSTVWVKLSESWKGTMWNSQPRQEKRPAIVLEICWTRETSSNEQEIVQLTKWKEYFPSKEFVRHGTDQLRFDQRARRVEAALKIREFQIPNIDTGAFQTPGKAWIIVEITAGENYKPWETCRPKEWEDCGNQRKGREE